MLEVGTKNDLSILLNSIPARETAFINQSLTPAAIRATGRSDEPLDYLLKAFTHHRRELGRGLLDVDLPLRVHRVWDIDGYPAEFREFGLAREPQPPTRDDETFLAIDVEPLRFQMSLRTANFFPLFPTHPLVMGKRMASDQDITLAQSKHLFRVLLRGGM